VLLGAKIALKNRQVAIEPTIGCGQTLKLSPVRCQAPSKAPLSSAVISSGKAVRTEVADFDPDRFWQMHRGTIVSVDAVSGVMREGAGKQMQ
jgi:hypothetical protein